MKPETTFKVKAFLWDQFIRPLKLLLDSHQMKLLSLALVFISIIIFKSLIWFSIFFVITISISIVEIIQFIKSGEYTRRYRESKYPEYRAAIKKIRKEKYIVALEGLELDKKIIPKYI